MQARLLFVAALCVLAPVSLASAVPSGGGTTAPSPAFRSSVALIRPALRGRLTSWRPGCPVPIGRLRLVTVSRWGFDGRVRRGQLIVRRDQARKVVRAFRAIFAARVPIRRMRLVEAYGSSDRRSMSADNTSGFNCRPVEGSTSWSAHAYGLAIDVNPLENPYVKDGKVLPRRGIAYLDRSLEAKGMIQPGDAVVRAFRAIGWTWGGTWRSLKDYQHFSATGR
jgi:hypothetical protein